MKLPHIFMLTTACVVSVLIFYFWFIVVFLITAAGTFFPFLYIVGLAILVVFGISHVRASLAFYKKLNQEKNKDGAISEIDPLVGDKEMFFKNPVVKVLVSRTYYEWFYIKKTFKFER